MEARTLRIGKIQYANLFPVFYMLERSRNSSCYKFIEGHPSTVNRLLREGKIDISPSSSIEYLRHEDMYLLIEGHSISSYGPVNSVLLFSRMPIENLSEEDVLVSSKSETSIALLEIIFKIFYKIDCRLVYANEELHKALKSYPAYLLIGDDALMANKKFVLGSGLRALPSNATIEGSDSELFAYDLGDIWHEQTGLPFVFALWIARRDCFIDRYDLLKKFREDLKDAHATALKNLRTIAAASALKNIMAEERLISYWQSISFDLTDEHKRGLELFRKYAAELNLL